jgi:hypothetical protein
MRDGVHVDPMTLLKNASTFTERGPLRRLLPAAALVVLLMALIASGAAEGPPHVQRVSSSLERLGVVGAAALAFAVAASSIFLAPLFAYLGSVLRGTSMTGRLLYPVRALLTQRHSNRSYRRQNRFNQIVLVLEADPGNERAKVEYEDLKIALARTPQEVRPTILGNILAAAEDYPNMQYGLDSSVVLPRLLRVAPPEATSTLDGERDDLRFATDLCGALALAAVMLAGFLITDGWWVLAPIGAMILAWLSYRNAVEAAVVYGETLRVMFDLYRFNLYESLALPRPPDQSAELELAHDVNHLLWGWDVHLRYQH